MELNSQNIEHKALEADIERLSKEIAEKRNLLEHKDLSDRELVKKSLEPIIKQAAVQTQIAASQPSSIQQSVLPDYLQNSSASADVKLQVEELVDLTLRQGIEKAVKAAGKTNAFVLDAFHDALTDKLHGILKQKGIL